MHLRKPRSSIGMCHLLLLIVSTVLVTAASTADGDKNQQGIAEEIRAGSIVAVKGASLENVPDEFKGLCALDAGLDGALNYQCNDKTNWDSENYCNGQWRGVFCNGPYHSISLDGSDIGGALPTQIGLLTNFIQISFIGTGLTGIIPTQIGLLTGLQYLDLIRSKLVGTIPTEIGFLTKLQRLSLNGNSLTGLIPPVLGSLPVLHHLWLSGNSLGGIIPTQLCQLTTTLEYLNVKNNPRLSCFPTCLRSIGGRDAKQDICTTSTTTKPSAKPVTSSRRPHVYRRVSRSPSFGPHLPTKLNKDKKAASKPTK